MSADHIVRQLIEQDDQFDIGPLDKYVGPINFSTDVKEILEHAQFLKSQAESAGALNLAMEVNSLTGKGPQIKDVHCALLVIACEHFLADDRQMDSAYKRLKRHMDSIWS